jgi:amidase
MGSGRSAFGAAFLGAMLMAGQARAASYDVAEKSVAQLQADMASGKVTAEQLVQLYMIRIKKLDRAGPKLQSIIALNPDAIKEARALDRERKEKGPRSPLFGIPVLIKDNIETADAMPTTAGSLALKDNITHRDAPLAARLRSAGAVILGKTNLSEWANIRSSQSISGWSAIGGLTKNPYALDRNPCGSSAGSAAAAAASLAAVTIGTETDGSVTCPSSIDGIVGIKPTVGLVPRTYIVPISHSQDTPGPMTRTVADAAAVLTVIAGSDASDPATAEADAHKTDYTAALAGATLKGARLGVIRFEGGADTTTDEAFAAAVTVLKNAGAEVVELPLVKIPQNIGDDELTVLLTELKADLNVYLASTPDTVKTRSMAEINAFNEATPRETVLFGQDLFEKAEHTKGLSDPDYIKAHDGNIAFARATLDKLLADNKLDALITPTTSPSWRIDAVRGDRDAGESASLPAIAGYPHLTVPMGTVGGLPVGLSFIGPAWSEAKLLALGYAYEEAAPMRVPPKFIPSMETQPDIAKAFAPESGK